ncbi:MAG: MraY family glycosyltransferase [Thermodesulfobacteriota bacterium]|nr:MraY family glycosyltransferase [Thermodesulfobacteriota bacterium]
MYFLFSILIAFYIAVVLIPLLRQAALNRQLTDMPDERKVHERPTPRVGGIGIVAGAVAPVLFMVHPSREISAYLAGVLILFVTCVWDDLSGLNYKQKFLGQILAIVVTMAIGRIAITNLGIWGTTEIMLPVWIALPLTLFFVLGITNAINLADGLDGLAGGISILVFLSIGVLAYLDDNIAIVVCCLGIAGALLAFLRYNTFPATIFMGDTGSQFLGFSAATLCVYLTQGQSTAIAKTLPLIILGFPILDTLTVMSERMARGISPFKPDRRHFHHRLLRLGFTHKDAVLGIYIVQALMVFLSIRLRYFAEVWVVAIYLVLAASILFFFYSAHHAGWQFQAGIGSDRLINILAEKKLDAALKTLSLKTMHILLPLWLVWLSLSSSLTFFRGNIGILVLSLITLAVSAVNRRVFAVLFRLTSYAVVLYLLLTTQENTSFLHLFSPQLAHHLCWGVLAACAVIFLVVTRFETFDITPLDVLVIMIVISIPFLPVSHAKTLHLGTVAGGMVVFLWTSEILISQQKRWLAPLPLSCVAVVLILTVRYVLLALHQGQTQLL